MALTRISEDNITPGSITANSLDPAAVFIYDTTVSSNIVLLEGQNGLSVGPITIASNVSINIASNSRWVVI